MDFLLTYTFGLLEAVKVLKADIKNKKMTDLHEAATEANMKKEETPAYYDNSNGSLYSFAEQQKLNSWEFDLIKRIVRCRKKGNFKEDLEKSKILIDLYLKEFDTTKL